MSDAETIDRPPLSASTILVRYVLFAIVAGLSNIGMQEIVVRILPWAPIMISVLAGTAMGFFVKYLLEKRWVFLDGYHGHAAEAQKIAVYGFFGVGTTLLFWGIELGFFHFGGTAAAKYTGATIGLILGNWIKYQLDKRFVFYRGRP